MEESKGGVRLNRLFYKWEMHQKARLMHFLKLINMKKTKFSKIIKDNLLFYLIQPTKINKTKITLNQLENVVFILVSMIFYLSTVIQGYSTFISISGNVTDVAGK